MPMYEYDDFQKQAIEKINHGHSVIVSAPTGAGKTAIAEYVIDLCISRQAGAVYTAPIKALSNQKFRDFKSLYGEDKIGLLTGDVTINADAPILIMTTEIFRNTILDCPNRLASKEWVIFDEIHYIDDEERGTVWEESIILLPEHMKMLGLSATIPNIYELADWIKSLHGPDISVILKKDRPVPLEYTFQCNNKIFTSMSRLKDSCYPELDTRKKRIFPHIEPIPNKIISLMKYLSKEEMLPCIYFAFSRKKCEALAWEMSRLNFLTSEEKDDILGRYRALLLKYDMQTDRFALHMESLIKKGVAFHHAGMLPTMKEIIEQLFTSRLIKVIFTTETFALGINMPAKTVVIDELRKFSGTHFGFMRSRDLQQMVGRAGRRGIDEKGYAVIRVNPRQVYFKTLKRILFNEPEDVISQFNLSYACLLHLYEDLKDKIIDIYPKSFAYFQSDSRQHNADLMLIRAKLEMLKMLLYIRDNALTEKGVIASQVYGYELPVTEMLESGIFSSLSVRHIAALLSAIVFEPRKRQKSPRLPKDIAMLSQTATKEARRIIKIEKRLNIFPKTKKPHFHLALAIIAWIDGKAFDKLSKYTDVDPGELVRNFRMVIQLLRQLRMIDRIPPQLRDKFSKAMNKINRDEIDAERQLRME